MTWFGVSSRSSLCAAVLELHRPFHTTGDEVTSPFFEFGVPAGLVAALERYDIAAPFPVQSAAIPPALAGQDIAARAPTGSGKTLAFGLPLIARVGQAEPRKPRALILTPTRELADQIARELKPYAKVVKRRVLAVYGGTSIPAQRRALNDGVDVLVACPGRLQDLVDQRIVDLSATDIVVVDEADRMSDMGFLPAVRRLLDQTASSRQVMLFSATLDGDVATLIREYQHAPVEVSIDHDDGRISPADHVFHTVERPGRAEMLTRILDDAGRTIVFCRTRHGADRLARQLARGGVRAVAIHGGHAQPRRTRSLAEFTSGRVHVLVATDVAARGIHVDGIEQVVHFDPADDAKTYLHRSGRTARAGASGRVVSFIASDQVDDVAKLRRELGLTSNTNGRPVRSRASRKRQGVAAAASSRRTISNGRARDRRQRTSSERKAGGHG
jgi:superfamily II DNA/RNA helicase